MNLWQLVVFKLREGGLRACAHWLPYNLYKSKKKLMGSMSWTTRAEGKDAKGLFLPSMTEAFGCNLAMFIFSNCFKKN